MASPAIAKPASELRLRPGTEHLQWLAVAAESLSSVGVALGSVPVMSAPPAPVVPGPTTSPPAPLPVPATDEPPAPGGPAPPSLAAAIRVASGQRRRSGPTRGRGLVG